MSKDFNAAKSTSQVKPLIAGISPPIHLLWNNHLNPNLMKQLLNYFHKRVAENEDRNVILNHAHLIKQLSNLQPYDLWYKKKCRNIQFWIKNDLLGFFSSISSTSCWTKQKVNSVHQLTFVFFLFFNL